MPPSKTVYVIDDDDAVRSSLEFLLRSARFPVKSFESATAFLADFPPENPGCIVTDVRMPGMSGVDLLRRLKELGSGIPVIVITGHGDVQLAVEAMKAGAFDFLEKPFDDENLLASLNSALERTAQQTQRETELAEFRNRISGLSSREKDVLEGLVAGKANKIIAFDLGISPRTVEIYRANVMTKMGAKSLSELVRMALVAGIVKGSD